MAYGKIVADQIQHSSEGTVDTQYVVSGSAKAYQHLEQLTNTLQKSLNISSSTDNATGDFTANFTNSWSDAYYMFSHGHDDGGYNDAASYHSKGLTWTTTTFRYRSAYAWNASAGFADLQMATIVWHGDLA
jgi:hypothetical protein